MAVVTADVANNAVGKMRTMLAADGYELDVSVEAGSVDRTVRATAEACAECLVPKSVFSMIAADALRAGGVDLEPHQLRVAYPLEADH